MTTSGPIPERECDLPEPVRRRGGHAPKGVVRKLSFGIGDRTERLFDAVQARAGVLRIELEVIER